MEKCRHYFEDYDRPECWGTKERDVCSCGGDKTKCNFYPEIKEKALRELKGIVTNADRIRNMTDEELIGFIKEAASSHVPCRYCIPTEHDEYKYCTLKCKDGIMNWLKEKAKK